MCVCVCVFVCVRAPSGLPIVIELTILANWTVEVGPVFLANLLLDAFEVDKFIISCKT